MFMFMFIKDVNMSNMVLNNKLDRNYVPVRR